VSPLRRTSEFHIPLLILATIAQFLSSALRID
jgi:hypothetical protein